MWEKMKNEYINGDVTQLNLAEKYGVPLHCVQYRARCEKWSAQKKNVHENRKHDKTSQKPEKTYDTTVQAVDELTEELLDKVRQAINELEVYSLVDKHRTKQVKKSGVDTEEVQREVSVITQCKGVVKTADLSKITTTLRDICNIRQSVQTDEETLQKLDDVLNQLGI